MKADMVSKKALKNFIMPKKECKSPLEPFFKKQKSVPIKKGKTKCEHDGGGYLIASNTQPRKG